MEISKLPLRVFIVPVGDVILASRSTTCHPGTTFSLHTPIENSKVEHSSRVSESYETFDLGIYLSLDNCILSTSFTYKPSMSAVVSWGVVSSGDIVCRCCDKALW